MGFEIINDTNPAPAEEVVNPAPEEVVENPVEEEKPEPAPGEGNPAPGDEPNPSEDKPEEKPEEKPEPTEPVTFWYGEGDDAAEYEITIEADVRAAFEEKGLDVDALAAELYAKDGGFKLSEESLQKCYDAFGKFAIDAYIASLKTQNDATIAGARAEQEAAAQRDVERYTELTKDIGGDEGWNKLEAYALETLTDEELTAFNEVMNSGNLHVQRYAMRDLIERMEKANGVEKVTLIEGNSAPTQVANGPLSAADYQKEMVGLAAKFGRDRNGYAKAQAALDARRRAGMAAGL